jgi:hypothetical protein
MPPEFVVTPWLPTLTLLKVTFGGLTNTARRSVRNIYIQQKVSHTDKCANYAEGYEHADDESAEGALEASLPSASFEELSAMLIFKKRAPSAARSRIIL